MRWPKAMRRSMREFREWLAEQAGRQDPVGDFARDWAVCERGEIYGGCEQSRWALTLSSMDRHLIEEHGCSSDDKVLRARDRAFREFDSIRRHTEETALDSATATSSRPTCSVERFARHVLDHVLAKTSEEQAYKLVGLDRIELRAVAQAMEALVTGLGVDGAHHKQAEMRTALRHLIGVGAEEELRRALGYESGVST